MSLSYLTSPISQWTLRLKNGYAASSLSARLVFDAAVQAYLQRLRLLTGLEISFNAFEREGVILTSTACTYINGQQSNSDHVVAM